MKKVVAITVLFGLMMACKPEIKPIGTSYKAGEGIPGTWELSQLEVTDITIPVPETRDLSLVLNDPTNVLMLTLAEDGSYTVDQPGFGPAVFGSSGTWVTDTVDFPTMIMWYTDAGDTVNTGLLSMPRVIDNNFGFTFTRNRCDKDYVTYNYTFNRK